MGDESNNPAKNDANSDSAPQLSDVEIGRLLQENADLKTRIRELEADKQYFKQQIDFHLQRQTATPGPAAVPAQTSGTPLFSGPMNSANLPYTMPGGTVYPHAPANHPQAPVGEVPAKPRKPKTEFVPRKITETDAEALLHEDEAYPPEKPLLDPQLNMRIRQMLGVVVALGTVGALVLWIQNGFQLPFGQTPSETANQSAVVLPDGPSDDNTYTSEFERELQRLNERQLIEKLTSLEVKPDDPFVTKIDNYKKWIIISDRLLRRNIPAKDRQKAIRYKLNSMIGQELSKAELDVFRETETQALLDFSLEHVDSEDRLIARLAATGETLARVRQFVNEEDTNKRTALYKTALVTFDAFASGFADDALAANQLFQILQIVKTPETSSESAAFHHGYWQAFRDQEDRATAELVAQAKLLMGKQDLEFIDLITVTATKRSNAFEKLLVKLQTMQNGQTTIQESESVIEIALRSAYDLLRISLVDEAKDILQALRSKGLKKSKASEDRIQLLRDRISMLQRPFDLAGIQDSDGNPAKFTVEEARYRILCFVSEDSYEASFARVTETAQVLEGHLVESAAELVVIYLHEGDRPTDINNLKRFAEKNQIFKVWFLDVNSSAAEMVLCSVPIDSVPFVVVLDQQDRTVRIDPSADLIQKMMFE